MRRVSATAFIAGAAMLLCQNVGAQTRTDGADWLSFLGNDAGTSYSKLDQINRDTVGQLAPTWMFSIGGNVQNAVPVVVGGIMYLIGLNDSVYALDAASGKLNWSYSRVPITDATGYARGSASVVTGLGMVYYGTRDNHLIALDAASGREVWDVQIEDSRQCSCMPSHGILFVKGKLIVGVRGDVAHRGYINAFDAKTGHQIWRWWVIPGPGEAGHDTWPDYLWKTGGGSSWYAGAYDRNLNLIYWGTGNPQPMMGGTDPGAKLWTNSLVALDADTGEMKWGFQESPSSPFDYDSASEPLLVDTLVDGRMTPVVIHSVKSGYTYVLNRATGQLISAYPHADYINWTKGLDQVGKPIEPLTLSKDKIELICPSMYGSRAANHTAYSPQTGWWYGSSAEFCSTMRADDPGKLIEGREYIATTDVGTTKSPASEPFMAAFDLVTGKRMWKIPTGVPNIGSLIATGGGLIFGSDIFGEIWARDAVTGRKLWSFNVGALSANSPVTYAVGGKQYIAIALGGGGGYPLRIRELWPEIAPRLPPGGSTVVAFAISGQTRASRHSPTTLKQ